MHKSIIYTVFGYLTIFSSLFQLDTVKSQDFKADSLNLAVTIDSLLKTNDSLDLSRGYYKLGRLYDNWEKRDSAYLFLNRALEVTVKLKNSKGLATISNRLACLYSEEGLHEKALGIYDQCVDWLKESGDTNRIPIVLMNIGSEYEIMGDFDKAIEYKLRGLKMKEAMKDSSNIAYHYLFIGNVYKNSDKNTEKWKRYIDLAYKLKDNKEYADDETYCMIYLNLAEYAYEKGEHEKAFAYFDTLYVNAKRYNFIKGVYKSLSGKASLLSINGKHYRALQYIEEALAYLPEEQDVLINHNIFLAELYLKNNQPGKALFYLMDNSKKDVIDKFPSSMLENYKLLYVANKRQENFQQALKWNELYMELSDSLHNEKMLKNTEELETKYQTEKKETEIKQLSIENELKSQRIKFAIAAIIAIAVAAGFAIFLLIMRRRKIKAEQEQLKQRLFRSQMNPHFIFNALASIQNFLYKNEGKKAAGYLANFSTLTRSILTNSTKESISLEEEIETLKNYVELEKMRLKDAFDYEIKFDEELETEFINVPPMLIQPFVENAIKHGLKEKEEGGILTVSFIDKKDFLQVQVLDNGVGINNSKNEKISGHKSMALKIFDQRMKIIGKKMKNLPLPKIEDLSLQDKQGTLVEVCIPIFE